MGKKRGPYGKNMIKVEVRFWTNNLPKGADEKTAWAKGAITIPKNEYHGLEHDKVFFHKLEDLLPKFQEILDKNGIKLIEVPKQKYVEKKVTEIKKKGS